MFDFNQTESVVTGKLHTNFYCLFFNKQKLQSEK